MTFRTRLVITAAILCHLLPGSPLVTSRALAQVGAPRSGPASLAARRFTLDAAAQFSGTVVAPAPQGFEPVTIKADQQIKEGDLYTLRSGPAGPAEIDFRGFVITADTMTYNAATGEATLTGNVHVVGGPHAEDITAARGTLNVNTQVGRFEDVVGSVGLKRAGGRRMTLTSSNPFIFTGALVDKTGPGHYIVHHGTVTVCDQPTPAWTFDADRVIVEVGENAQLYHTTFRLRGLPAFYLPYVAHPIDNLGRQTGFLIPTLGVSSRKGTTIGDSFYWAINRSADMTLGAEYYSRRGWAQHGNLRYRLSDSAFLEARYFGVLDRGAPGTHQDQGGEEATLNAEGTLPLDIRAVANIDYLSTFVFRLAFNENFSQAVNSEVKSTAFLSKAQNGFFFNTSTRRYQNFESTARGDLVTILHAPSFEVSTVDRPVFPSIFRSKIVWSYEAATEGLSRSEPGFVTNPVVGRFDLTPRISAPIGIRGWTFRPELAVRETYYTQRVVPNGSLGVLVDNDVNRRAIEGSFELRPPALSRIFDRKVFGRTLKHTIETRATYRYVNGIENFNQIIRFDARDIFSDTNEAEYGIVNRLYAKRHSAGGNCPPPGEPAPPAKKNPADDDQAISSACDDAGSVREIVSWEVAQKAFFQPDFGGAVVNGRRNVLTTTAEFTGIAFLTEPRTWSPVISRLRVNLTNNADLQWNLDYDQKKGFVNASTLLANFRFGEVFFGGSHAFLHVPGEIFVSPTNPVAGPDRFNQFRVLVGYGHPNKRGLSVAGNVGFDYNLGFLQYGSGQISYNWDCMGLSVEYRRLALGSVRNENQFRFSLSLANIGTFGTLRRQERLF